ncbi:MAG: RluA family pseudouridine synthase [Elusimicrobia bacterium]|nr:RluA family pseudouridine synthase [Elusimicrobiota bacterium]
MENLKFEGVPQRLDVFVTERETGFSREFAKKMINEGRVLVNGRARKPSFLLSPDDLVTITLPETGKSKAGKKDKEDLEAILIYEDKDMLAISKPAGLAVHPNDSNWMRRPQACLMAEATVVSMLLKARPALLKSGVERLGLVHRLDRDTSGIMLAAKTKEAQTALQRQFREREVAKTYLGVVSGVPAKKTGSIDAPIGRASGFKKIKVWEYGRDALTEFKVIEKTKRHALLEIYPRTGRTNQIRIHLEFIKHPVVGDKLYGGEPAARLLLHAYELIFTHPSKDKKTSLSVTPPEEFTREWARLKQQGTET